MVEVTEIVDDFMRDPRVRGWNHATFIPCGNASESLWISPPTCRNTVWAFSCRTWQLWNMRILRVRLTASYFSLLLDTIERKLPRAICYKLYQPPVAGPQWDSLQSFIIACSPVCCLQGHEVPNFNLSVQRASTFSDTVRGGLFFMVMVVVVICLTL
jgi:hypothetical protein